MEVVQLDPATLKPHPRNSRLHSDEQITALGRAILAFGFHQPVVVDKSHTILVGHARTRAAIGIGLKSVPCVVVDMPDAKARALVIADNRLHELGAGWDRDILDGELRDLMAAGIDVSLTGFDVPELQVDKAARDEEEAPDLGATAIARAGDVWEMGGHRLVVGSCTDPQVVATAMAGHEVNLMVTDPPYGVDYDPEWRNRVIRADGSRITARATGRVTNDDRADWREAWALFPGDVAYVWHGGVASAIVQRSLEAAGFGLKGQIIWDKGRHVIGRGAYHWRHEPCAFAVRQAKKARENWRGGRGRQSSVWQIQHRKSASGHGTQKPVDAMRRPILNHTAPGEVIYDPFLGSGTSLIAAHTSARRCVGTEIDPLYADVIVKRYEGFTGMPAVLAATGETFAAVAEARLAA
jgi:DNA modification methylase